MNKMEFSEYLQGYVLRLSGLSQLNMTELTRQAVTSPRLREPLALYAMSTRQTQLLLELMPDSETKADYQKLFSTYTYDAVVKTLQRQDTSLPSRYLKVWTSYNAQVLCAQKDAKIKNMMKEKVNNLLSSKRLSVQTTCKALNLDTTVVNDWLKENEVVDLQTAQVVYNYVRTHVA